MKRFTLLALLALTTMAPVHASSTLRVTRAMTAVERAGLASHVRPDLAERRAGARPAAPVLKPAERDALVRAQDQTRHLRDLRAGALTDRELTYVIIGVLIVIALVLIL